MSRSARFTGVFGDGKYDFQLNIGELEEHDEKCQAGPEEVYHRVSEGKWRVPDIRETLRLGLKGAGMDSTKALILVERYAGPGQFGHLKPLVLSILAAVIVGSPEEDAPPGETTGASADAPTPAPSSASSTKSAGKSGSRRRKSSAPASGN